MPNDEPFAYALLRAVPQAPRGESLNVGVVLFCRRADFLGLRWTLQRARLLALDPTLDLDALAALLRTLERVVDGDPQAGSVARQPPSERFHWLVAPSSTIVVPGEVHTGLTSDPRLTLDRLFEQLVA
ncbi:MAG TPA: DUF3037 domain-containing protein [Solirubrobacteraceae bacterium]|jgi:hypothetical protein